MKTFKILSLIFAPLTIIFILLTIFRDLAVISKIDKYIKEEADVSTSEMVSKIAVEAGLPSSGSLYLAISVVMILALVTLMGIMFAIKNNPKIKLIGLSIIGIAIIAILVHPSFNSGSMRGASPKALAIITSVPSIIAGLFMFLFAGKLKPEN